MANDKDVLKIMEKMIPLKAISPASGGEGEGKRADYLQALLKEFGLEVQRYEYLDENKVKRPNLVAKCRTKGRTIWILGHMDTVTEGDISLWNTDPFKAIEKNGRVYGRGTQDNGCGVVSGILSLKDVVGKRLKYNFGLVLVADEEVGSKHGIQRLIKEKIFNNGDMFIVPDSGAADGSEIEIAEKSILWLKATVIGKQVHGSTPYNGLNAFKEAAKFAIEVDKYLYKKYSNYSKLMRSTSTFEMTKHEKNVDSINIIPGMEVLYFDCRVLPEYSLDSVLKDINAIAKKSKAKIKIEVVQREDAPKPTAADSEIVNRLSNAIKKTLKVSPKLVGIGGGTVAAYLRRAGFDAVVWSIENDIAHQPNEYVEIKNVINVARVFSGLFLD